jgi:hypothetical protein
MNAKVKLDKRRIADFCRRWKISELSLFGSALREDFRPDSDFDVLVSFTPDAEWSLMDHATMQEEIAAILGRKVDLISRRAVEQSSNWIRRENILSTAEPLYVA